MAKSAPRCLPYYFHASVLVASDTQLHLARMSCYYHSQKRARHFFSAKLKTPTEMLVVIHEQLKIRDKKDISRDRELINLERGPGETQKQDITATLQRFAKPRTFQISLACEWTLLRAFAPRVKVVIRRIRGSGVYFF